MAETLSRLVDENDPELESGTVRYGSCTGYMSRPRGGTDLGSVIVIHENVGLVDHIKDVARHFAKEGFAALAPDLLQRTGGTGQYATSQEAIAAIRSLDPEGCVEDLTSTLEYLKGQGFTNGKVGVVGYCWGGGQSLNFATRCNRLHAAVVYYGRNPDPLEAVARITCPLMGNYADDDPNIIPGIEPLKEALARNGKTIDLKSYGHGARHAFNNNTNADRYHPEAAADAWRRTVNFYRIHLAG